MNSNRVPQVSVIVPVYNAERYILASLASILQQTPTDYEVILVDDGSTDGTREAARSAHGAIRYIYQANQGPAAARNAGINVARGEFVCFLDADDSWSIDKLSTQLAFMAEHPSVGLVFADEEEFDDCGVVRASLLGTSQFHQELRSGGIVKDAFRKLLVENFVPTSTVMVRRACFAQTGVFDVTLKGPEDRDMWSRIAVQFPIGCIPRVLGRKRVVASSVSRDVEMTLRSRIRMWTKARRLFPELAAGQTVNALLAPTYVHLGFVLMQKGNVREARSAGLKGLAASRNPSGWLRALSLLVCTLAGAPATKFAFNTKRRLLRSRS